MSVPAVAKFRRLLDSLPRETLPDVVASMIRTSNKEKLQVKQLRLDTQLVRVLKHHTSSQTSRSLKLSCFFLRFWE